MSGVDTFHSHQRTQSHSKFAAFPSSQYSSSNPPVVGLSTLERCGRSKSYDNRRELLNDITPRTRFTDTKYNAGSNNFFNESITIPIHAIKASSGQAESSAFAPADKTPTSKLYRSAIELNSATAEDEGEDEWTSYDKKIRFSHNRTELPPIVTRPFHYHEHSSRRHHLEPTYAIRSAESDYNVHQARQQEHLHQQQQNRLDSQYQTQQRRYQSDYDTRAAEAAAGVYRAPAYFYEDDGASTYGRTGGFVSSKTNGEYRGQQHRSGGGENRAHSHYSHHTSGYDYSGANKAHYKSHVNTNRGGLFGTGKNAKSKSYHHYHDNKFIQPKRTVHHKVHCCCFSFYWPPWGYERCEPPTPIFYSRKEFARASSNYMTPQISPRHHYDAYSHPPQLFSPEPTSAPTNITATTNFAHSHNTHNVPNSIEPQQTNSPLQYQQTGAKIQ